MNSVDFDFVRKLVRNSAAISLDDTKQYLVQSRLEPLAVKVCGGSMEELLRQLRAQPRGELHTRVVEAMTTNETYFFRDNSPFEALRKAVLPAVIKRAESSKVLTIWSAACSSGQEAYSIAMMLDTYFPTLRAGPSRSWARTSRRQWSSAPSRACSPSSRSTAGCRPPC